MAVKGIPSPDVPFTLPNGLINPVWYQFIAGGGLGGGSGLPSGSSDGYVLGSTGTTPTWLGFIQAGIGAIVRKWQDKMRDIVSVKDYGTTTTAFNAALAANSGVYVPPGTYSASPTVAYDQLLEFAPGASGISAASITNEGTVVRWNYNPSGLTWTNWSGKDNKAGLQVDLGGYGDTTFGNPSFNGKIGLGCGIVGSVKIPSYSTNPTGGMGVAGYGRSDSTVTFGVGIYGQGEIGAANCAAWGGNTLVTDNGQDANQLWGMEVDANIYNSGSNVLGVDVTGGSTTEVSGSNLSIGYSLQPLGVFTSPPKRWFWGFKSADGAAAVGMEFGASSVSGTSIASQRIQFAGFNSGGGRITPGRIGTGANGTLNLDGDNGVSIRGSGGSFAHIIATGSALSFYNTGRSVGLQTIGGSRSTQTVLVLSQVVSALHNMGLIEDTTTT